MIGSSIASSGIYLPERKVSNASLEDALHFEQGFIEKTTGIKERRRSERHETVEYMASIAAVNALKETETKKIDALFFCRDAILTKRAYSLAPNVKKSLSEIGVDVKDAFPIDTVNGCTGYASACNMASLMINAGQINNALVIASANYADLIVLYDHFNRGLNNHKESGNTINRLVRVSAENAGFQAPALNAFLWGCGAGAVLIERTQENKVLGSTAESNHRFPENNFAMGEIMTGESFCVLDGASIYKYAISEIPGFVNRSAEKLGLDLLKTKIVPHQPQPRMLDRLAEKINIPRENLMMTCDYLGNMIAASVPITYHLAKQEGKIKAGDDVAFLSFGDSYLASSLFAFKEAKK